MRHLPPEPGHPGGGGKSAFADFLSRLRPYPPPPGFEATLLYAALGAVGLLVAGAGLAILPTDLAGDGFHAIGAAEAESLLEVFSAPASAFALSGLAGLAVTALTRARRRVGPVAGAALVGLTLLGVVAVLWATLGWLVWAVAFVTNLFLVLAIIASIPVAAFLFLRGDVAGAIAVLVLALAVGMWFQQATSDPATSGPPAPRKEAAAPPPAEEVEPPPVSPAVEQQRMRAEERQLRRQQKQEALTQRRIALEARMDAEYAGWLAVPYVPPCNSQYRREELGALREEFAGMKQRLREAARYGKTGVFRKVAGDLERVAREREQALADPASIYEQSGRCPSGAGAMRFLW